MNIHRLSIVLGHANRQPPFESTERADFYALKSQILEKFAVRAGTDIQHIKKDCWKCSGSGWLRDHYYEETDEICYKCDGTGVYSEKWVELQRWDLAGRIFHSPIRTLVGSLVPATIEGLISHKSSPHALACRRALYLAFNPRLYLYWDQFRLTERDMRRFRVALAFLMDIPRGKFFDFGHIQRFKAEQIGNTVTWEPTPAGARQEAWF